MKTTQSSSSSSPPASSSTESATTTTKKEALTCPICIEEMTLVFRNNADTALGRPCCGQMICQSCFYRHICSIITEGITGSGRNTMTCPFGCGSCIKDLEIRSCFHRKHYNWIWNIIGYIIFKLLLWINQDSWEQDSILFNSANRYYDNWLYFCHTQNERNDLQRYERWSLTVATSSIMRQQQQQQALMEDNDDNHNDNSSHFNNNSNIIMQCPAPNCDHFWYVANPNHYDMKRQHERRKVYLWYSPPKAEPPVPFDWVQPEYLMIEDPTSSSLQDSGATNQRHQFHDSDSSNILNAADDESKEDSRYVVCAKCHATFCGLCKRPWVLSGSGSITHRGVACKSYASKLRSKGISEDDDDFAFSAQMSDSRICPGCSMRTSRIDGCNHMTCPCGMEWCYVCECRWNPIHYSCVDNGRRNNTDACIIS